MRSRTAVINALHLVTEPSSRYDALSSYESLICCVVDDDDKVLTQNHYTGWARKASGVGPQTAKSGLRIFRILRIGPKSPASVNVDLFEHPANGVLRRVDVFAVFEPLAPRIQPVEEHAIGDDLRSRKPHVDA